MNKDASASEMVIFASEAMELSGVLRHLRVGRLDRAFELLEIRLDTCVVALDGLVQQIQSSDRDRVVQALRHVREYRNRHPRRTETDLSTIDKDKMSAAFEIQERVRKILENID